MSRRPKTVSADSIVIRFTGAAGGTCYVADDGKTILRIGDTIRLRGADPHWFVLLDSGNAEVAEE